MLIYDWHFCHRINLSWFSKLYFYISSAQTDPPAGQKMQTKKQFQMSMSETNTIGYALWKLRSTDRIDWPRHQIRVSEGKRKLNSRMVGLVSKFVTNFKLKSVQRFLMRKKFSCIHLQNWNSKLWASHLRRLPNFFISIQKKSLSQPENYRG